MASVTYDMVVVGGGIIGTCAAYHAQKAGLKTLLIEQFNLGHNYGSSAGKSRIIRYAHTEAEYLPLVHESFKQITEMEKKRGEKLWVKTGLVWMGSTEEIKDLSKVLNDFKCDNEILSNIEVSKRYPQLNYGREWAGLVDPMGGVILADRWLAVYQDEFRKLGGAVMENTRVESYEDGSTVTLKTTNGPVQARKALFALGTWINKLFPDIPVQSRNELISVAYWVPKDKKDEHLVMPDKYPVIIVNDTNIGYYSLPSVDYIGAVKYAYHEGEVYDVDKEIIDFDKKYINKTREHLKKHMPFLDAENGPWRIDRCKYAMSPDDQYVVDFLPGSTNIQIAGCMSGTGFKNGPSLGRALAQIAKGEKPYVDLSAFAIKRFKKSKL